MIYSTVDGRPEMTGSEWQNGRTYKYVSLIMKFSNPIYEGYINRLQIYSVRAGVTVRFQIWRMLSNQFGGAKTFLLVSQHEHKTRSVNAFENTVRARDFTWHHLY